MLPTDHIKSGLVWLAFTFTVLSCQRPSALPEVAEPVERLATYQELHRPQFHFSPDSMWMNDPNGMVYYEGEYHLFYQYYPDSTVWGPMHWGHAITEDLVHWEHLPIALYPDSLGYIFSGSAVVDWHNTSGFGTEDHPPLVAIYTYHDAVGAEAERLDFQTQGIAYSTDKGRNWTKYEGNPVIPNPGIRDFRDPKVIWHDPSERWVMIFAAFDHVKLYTSPDLKRWEWVSDFGKDQGSHGGVWECPDLFPLTTSGGEQKWMMIVSLGDGAPNGGSGTQYFIGDFDGRQFTNENPSEEVLWLDYGRDNYAGVTWSDIPENDGRRIFLGWMSNWRYAQVVPTGRWRSAMTLPRELQLKDTPAGMRVVSIPVKEIEDLHLQSQPLPTLTITDGQPFLVQSSFDPSLSLLEFTATPEQGSVLTVEFSNERDQKVLVTYNTKENRLLVDRTNSGKTSFSEEFAGVHNAPRLTEAQQLEMKIYLDHSSLEIFMDHGEVVLTDLVFPDIPYSQIRILSSGGSTKIEQGSLTALKSIW